MLFFFPGARPYHVWPRLIFTYNDDGKMKSSLHEISSVLHIAWALTTVKQAKEWLPVPVGLPAPAGGGAGAAVAPQQDDAAAAATCKIMREPL